MTDSTPYNVPREPGRWRAIALAVAVHAALFAFLWIGIRWQSETPVAIEAEVWDMQAKEAAPKAAPPQPEPKPEPRPEPRPEPASKPEPKPAEQAPVEKPDIALEQEKKKKARREEEERLARQKEEKERAEKEKQELAKKEKERQLALEKEKLELARKEKAEAERKRQEALDKKLLEAMRKDAQKNLAGSGGTGTVAKSQGMRGDPGYAAKVAAKIKSNTAFVVPSDLQGNPAVEYEVQLFPDGSLRGAPRKVKSSGIPAFDEAVRRAIELSAPFPADKSGSVPSGFPVIHRPKEQ